MNRNYNCGGSSCKHSDGEIRVLPTGGDSNALLCYDCYVHEMQYRRERNRELGSENKYQLPLWEELKVYEH